MSASTYKGASVRIFPRRKGGAGGAQPTPDKHRAPMEFSLATIAQHFHEPQAQAAKTMGVSITSIKQICRRLGIVKWP